MLVAHYKRKDCLPFLYIIKLIFITLADWLTADGSQLQFFIYFDDIFCDLFLTLREFIRFLFGLSLFVFPLIFGLLNKYF